MKLRLFSLVAGLLSVGSSVFAANLAPTVSISSPAQNAVFSAPTNLAVTANATDSDGSVAKVEFYQNNLKFAEDTTSPFGVTWTNTSPGFYTLTAIAFDNLGASGTSAPVSITVNASGAPTTNSLIALGSLWKYFDKGALPDANWATRTFDDTGWSNGLAQLGYGDNDEATTISFGPDQANKYITSYFRRSFSIADPARVQNLVMNLLRDDGAVIYVNGVEVFRTNMPSGPILYSTLAGPAANDYPFDNNIALFPANLIAGNNMLAAEVHQANVSSSDVSFELELLGVVAGSTNLPPIVSIMSPPNGTIFAAPSSTTVTVGASDSEGTVTNVAFYVNGVKQADDASSPYNFAWNNVPAGNYALTAVAVDNTGLSATSSVVNITVSTNTAAPVIASKSPSPGSVTSLTQISVTFSKNVGGVNASDLLINGVPASGSTGSGSNYVFTFPQPAYGTVLITWSSSHGISDLFTPSHAFDENGAGAAWQYQLIDQIPPVIASADPIPGSTVAALTNVSVLFNEPVTGVNAGDLLINAVPAGSVSGSGPGPYLFTFAQPPQGNVQLSWAVGHGIQDSSGNNFAGSAWGYNLDTNVTGVVISEIMYHPASENVLEEYIELLNKGASPVNVGNWKLVSGVQFTFPNVTIPPAGYLVVAADLATFNNKYPGVTNVVGNWIGLLRNSGEDIDLNDAAGKRVDSVDYAEKGDWAIRRRGLLDGSHRGWEWFAEHDGLGKSLELINANLSNNRGQNWAASRTVNGTPGTVNSVSSNNIPPMIVETRHFPIVPRSTNNLLITTRIIDEAPGGISATLFYRVDSATPPPFSTTPLYDDGANGGDASANDGIYSATLAPFANNSVIEYFVRASDLQGNIRTWPAPAIPAPDQTGSPTQAVNALFQIDDSTYSGSQPLYKLIMTEIERAELAAIPSQSSLQGPNSQMNGTFISIDTAGTELHYRVGIRNRGHGSRTANPPNYRVNFPTDDLWKGVGAINLNSVNVHIQHLGSVLARKGGGAGANTIPVQVRVNNINRATSGSPMFGSYAANEVQGSDWAENHFPFDSGGNVYRAIRDISPPDFSYRGEDPNSYRNTWFKESNVSEDDWSDLIGMLRVVGINNSTPFTTENVRNVVNVEQWLRHLALMNLFGNNETGLNTGYNDDYFMYRGINDPRFLLTYYDLDTILGEGGSLGPTDSIFTATLSNGSGQAMNRFMHWPDFEPIYYRILKELLDTTFSQAQFNFLVDQALGNYVTPGTISSIKSWMDARRNYVLSVLPAISNTTPPVATISNIPRSPTPRTAASLVVGGNDVTHYRYSLNGGAYLAETPVATRITLSGLGNGTNRVAVIGKNSAGIWQDQTNATLVSWVVNTAWPGVRLNEVLARNDSAVNHSGTFPDLIELYNEGATVDLSGLRLTDDPAAPSKFTFPPGTSLSSNSYLVVYANNPDATPGLHTGFSLNQDGDGVYLFDRTANGGALLDSVTFGLQLPNLSIGRFTSGEWILTQPTELATNVAQAQGNYRNLKINEWLAAGQSPYAEDFIELFNPDAQPVALGGMHLTDQPIGAPALHRIAPLSFIAAAGHRLFLADKDPEQGANHLNFRLEQDQGEIGLMSSDLSVVDCVLYGPQKTDVSMGRCPDGALNYTSFAIATPGGPNACPFVPPTPQAVTLISITNIWKYDQSDTDRGVAWRGTNYNDSAWPSGPGLLAALKAGQTLPEPVRTTLTTNVNRNTFYFRTAFVVPPNATFSSLEFRHIIDDGAAFYVNSNQLPRFQLTADPLLYSSLASVTIDAASYQGPVSISPTLVHPGTNIFAVEVHQGTTNSSDMAFGLELTGVVLTNSATVAGLLINEVLANNGALEESDGSKPDWLEIYNPSTNAVDMADMSLSDVVENPRRWPFPIGSLVPAHGFLKVRMDGDALASTTNTGFGLKANGGSVFLFNRPADGGALASAISYGLQAPDWSIGRVPDGSSNWVLTLPTFGSANIAATLGNAQLLKVNEWMANPASGEDWFEIYNPNAQPVNLSQLWLSDNLVDRMKYQIPALSFIASGPNGFQRFDADSPATFQGADHVSFKLSAAAESVAISTSDGTLINGISFSNQLSGVSEGRLPDGSDPIVQFASTPTPGNGNFLPLNNVVINELLSHTDPPLEDAVELYNPSGDDVNITGWYLSDSQNNLLKYRITNSTIIPPGGYVVFYEYQFNVDNPGEPFSFSSAKGDEAYLSQASAPGVLTGFRAFAEFGAAENGVSFGRFRTSQGYDFTALSTRTFGHDNPSSTNDFRMGTGLTNSYPKVGPVVINEIMYHPADTNDALEYIELHNILGTPVPLYYSNNPSSTWRLRKGVNFDFPPSTTIPAGGFLVIVSFDPQTDAASLAAFQSAYGTGMTLLGPYSGKLDNGGEALELQKPDAPQTVPGPDFGLVPFIAVDRVVYSDSPPWPSSPDGLGDALKRITASLYGNDPLNWFGGLPSPGEANVSGTTNTAPVLAAIGNRVINEGALLSFTANATDSDLPGQTLTYSLDAGAPAGAAINANSGAFTWTPAENQGPGSYSVTVRVTDSGTPVLSDSETISITVNEVNRAPVLTPIGNKIVNEGSLVTFTADTTDPDIPLQTLTFSLDAGAPAGATINSASGVFTWTPGETNGPGVFSVTVRVTDNGLPALSDTETISITVNEANVAPALAAIADKFVNEGAALTFTASATDVDLPVQLLSFSLEPGAPPNASINPSTGSFTWTPPIGHMPVTNSITVTVSDNGSPILSASRTFKAIVVGRPRITSISVTGGIATLIWESFPGKNYQVKVSTDLVNWTDLGNQVHATGSTASASDPVVLNSARFYKVQQVD